MDALILSLMLLAVFAIARAWIAWRELQALRLRARESVRELEARVAANQAEWDAVQARLKELNQTLTVYSCGRETTWP